MGILMTRPRLSKIEIRELLLYTQKAGINIDAVISESGLALDGGELLRKSHLDFISAEQASTIIFSAVKALEIKSCTQLRRKPMTKSDFELLCYCIITCATLGAALDRAIEFMNALGDRAATLAIRTHNGIASFSMDTQRGDNHDGLLPDLLGLAGYARLFSWLIGEDIQPITLSVRYPQLLSHELATLIAPFFVLYSKTENQLHFPRRYLESPLIRTHEELELLLRFFPFDGCTIDLSATRIAPKIRRLILIALQRNIALPSALALSQQLNISVPTLRRRLNDEGTSISQLRDDCRHSLAIHLLQQQHIGLAQIAERLGYSDTSAFRRAFNAWTGISPSQYRHDL